MHHDSLVLDIWQDNWPVKKGEMGRVIFVILTRDNWTIHDNREIVGRFFPFSIIHLGASLCYAQKEGTDNFIVLIRKWQSDCFRHAPWMPLPRLKTAGISLTSFSCLRRIFFFWGKSTRVEHRKKVCLNWSGTFPFCCDFEGNGSGLVVIAGMPWK